MKKSLIVPVHLVATLLHPCFASNTVDQQPQPKDSLNFQRIEIQIKEQENNFLFFNHLKSSIADINLPDSTQVYQFNASTDSVLKERTLYTYNQAGKIQTELQYRWNKIVNRWLDFKYENSYDRLGRLTNKHYKGSFIQQFTGSINYNGVEYKDTAVVFSEERSYVFEYDFIHDRSGRLITLWRFTLDEFDIPVATWYRVSYDANGNKASVYISDGRYTNYLEEYAYDSNKNIMTITESRFIQYNYISVTFCTSKIKYEYAYNAENRVSNIQTFYFSFKANEWRKVAMVDYSYHDNGLLDSRLYSIIDTTHYELMPADRTDFKYNKNSKIQLREDYAWNKITNHWDICKKLYYYYNNSDPKARTFENTQASETPLCIFPNPARDILWIENTGNSDSIIRIYNDKGRCVKTEEIPKGLNTISLYQLPKGIYFVTVPFENALKSQKLIIE